MYSSYYPCASSAVHYLGDLRTSLGSELALQTLHDHLTICGLETYNGSENVKEATGVEIGVDSLSPFCPPQQRKQSTEPIGSIRLLVNTGYRSRPHMEGMRGERRRKDDC